MVTHFLKKKNGMSEKKFRFLEHIMRKEGLGNLTPTDHVEERNNIKVKKYQKTCPTMDQ